MNRSVTRLLPALIAALIFALPARASDAQFLQSLSGNWTGGGPVRMTPDSSPVNVSCSLAGEAAAASASLGGSCTGMVIFSREIGADLQLQGGTFVGTYVGSPRGTASLSGRLSGNTLEMALQWPGHPPATMRLAQPAEGQMVLTTIEQNQQTGENVVTAELRLTRQ